MSKNIALGIIIGGAVASTLGRSVSDAKGKIGALKKEAGQTRMWQKAIGDTQKLKTEIDKLKAAGGDTSALERKLETQEKKLKRAKIAVHDLEGEYARLGRTVRSLDLKAKGLDNIGKAVDLGKGALGDAAKVGAATAVPASVAADYQAIIRDIAIKAGVANTRQEAGMSRDIIAAAKANGIGRNVLAQAVNELVGGGMDLGKAVSFAPLVAKFSVGQGSEAPVTAGMIKALEQNAKINDPAAMAKALETIAYLGKAGSFESADMARWFPELLAEMQKLGITGQDSVQQLGAMLQVQMKTAGSSEQAANNLKNWFSKIGSNETEKNYKKAGIDYQSSMRAYIKSGVSTAEASFMLAQKYIEKTDPAKAKKLKEKAGDIGRETDAAKRRAMLSAFEETMKTGDLFADMQVKAALTAYMQNSRLYADLKKESAQASSQLDKDLADRRATSKQIWEETGQAWDNAMRSMGDALAPITDSVGKAVGSLGNGIASLAENAPGAAVAIAGIGVAVAGIKAAAGGALLIKGARQLAQGALLARAGGAAAAAAAGAGGTGAASTAAAAGAGALAPKIGAAVKAALGRVAGAGAGVLGGGAGRAVLAAANPATKVLGAGMAGYALGNALGLDKLGGWIGRAVYDATHRGPAVRSNAMPAKEQAAALSQAVRAAKPPQVTVQQAPHFAPRVAVTVKGDVKDPAKLAQELWPHLKGLFAQYQASAAATAARSAALHDAPHL